MATLLSLHNARRSRDLPQPTNVDELYRVNEQADCDLDPYYTRPSAQKSAPLAAFCFLAMVGLVMWIGLIAFVRWSFGW